VVDQISCQGRVLAILIRSSYTADGIEFFTPNDFSQQLAYISHPSGHTIKPHIHNQVTREVNYTKEVLFIKQGRIRVDFYDEDKSYLESRIVESGDVILLAYGGHGFEILEPSIIIEVKQGPYAGLSDKTHFKGIDADQAVIKMTKESDNKSHLL